MAMTQTHAKDQVLRSVDSKDKTWNGRTDGGDSITFRAKAVGNEYIQVRFHQCRWTRRFTECQL